ncbi:hypothetical protein BLNAU_15968 [Blattamonas nauphoetae]|uniref:Uncharacterized protein n=1 Tax=Blattamonas nauphoetae TaxID=2049346 RepID=A0ABQ9XCU9_9EUKA|nr:hypothetical protein BLNAU_15968 [Blattamonas nauphoetae]
MFLSLLIMCQIKMPNCFICGSSQTSDLATDRRPCRHVLCARCGLVEASAQLLLIGLNETIPASKICCGSSFPTTYQKVHERSLKLKEEISGDDVGDQIELTEEIKKGAEEGNALVQAKQERLNELNSVMTDMMQMLSGGVGRQESAFRLTGLTGIFGQRQAIKRPRSEQDKGEGGEDDLEEIEALIQSIDQEIAANKKAQAEAKAAAQAVVNESRAEKRTAEGKLKAEMLEKSKALDKELTAFKAEKEAEKKANKTECDAKVKALEAQKKKDASAQAKNEELVQEINGLKKQLLVQNQLLDHEVTAMRFKVEHDKKVLEIELQVEIDELTKADLAAASEQKQADLQSELEFAKIEAECKHRRDIAAARRDQCTRLAALKEQYLHKVEAARSGKESVAEKQEAAADSAHEKSIESTKQSTQKKIEQILAAYEKNSEALVTKTEKSCETEKTKTETAIATLTEKSASTRTTKLAEAERLYNQKIAELDAKKEAATSAQ